MLTDRDVFDVTRIPERDLILQRHDEINAVSESLRPVLDGDRGRQTYIFGPSGTGKTLVARFVLRRLQSEGLESRQQYINCWRYHSRSGFLTTLARETGAMQSIPQLTPHDELLAAVDDHDDQPLILTLDEADLWMRRPQNSLSQSAGSLLELTRTTHRRGWTCQ